MLVKNDFFLAIVENLIEIVTFLCMLMLVIFLLFANEFELIQLVSLL